MNYWYYGYDRFLFPTEVVFKFGALSTLSFSTIALTLKVLVEKQCRIEFLPQQSAVSFHDSAKCRTRSKS